MVDVEGAGLVKVCVVVGGVPEADGQLTVDALGGSGDSLFDKDLVPR